MLGPAPKGYNLDPKKKIDYFADKWHFLCNFFERSVRYDGLVYNSSEAAFAAQKETNSYRRVGYRTLSPGAAKSRGRKCELRPDWEKVKFRIMSEVVHAKFMQHPDLAKKLYATGQAFLEEGNTWADVTWGTVNGRGKNWLGVILMAERTYLKDLQLHKVK